jgi:uncharacterized membrane-anchored protein YhcB (DUF1043 family)
MFIIGLIIGFVAGFLVYRKHPKQFKELEEKLQKAEETVRKVTGFDEKEDK